jgi:uncharacterized delta-60 repeat protein/uncharacterized repeat protein (TIGR02543 family)
MKHYPQSRSIARRALTGLCVFGILGFIAVAALACKGPLGSASPVSSAGSGIDFEITIPGSPPVASARSTILTDGSVFKVKVYGLLLGAVTPPTVLTKVGDVWRGRAEDLVPGYYQFYAWAYDADASVLYYGKTADPVPITEDENTRVDIITTAAASAIIDLRTPGPAGGLIFYDHGSIHPGGWRYLEAAPPIGNDYYETQWQSDTIRIGSDAEGSAVGTGNSNTSAIAAWQLGQSMSGTAALVCDGLLLTDNGITYDDWFLPSKDELGLMRSVLHVSGYGGYSPGTYWSSTEYLSGVNAVAAEVNFTSGEHSYRYKTYTGSRVRPARSFATVPLYRVSYDTNGGSSGTVPVDTAWYVSSQEVSVKGNLNGLLGPVLRDGIRQRFLGWSTDSAATTALYIENSTFNITGNTTLYAVYTSDDSAVGKIGPAGGLIFKDWFVVNSVIPTSVGYRYLEAAPVETEFTGKMWSATNTLIGGTDLSWHWGKRNTVTIVSWLDEIVETNRTDRAAYLADQLNHNGFSDWFLPSGQELSTLLYYDLLRVSGLELGDFSAANYWSSSEATYNAAHQTHLGTGSSASEGKGNTYRVRAIRAFRNPAKETWAVVYLPNNPTSGTAPSDAYHYQSGDTVTFETNSGSLVKTNYVFAGWNTKADGSGTTYDVGSTIEMPAGNLVLYAKWEIRPGSLDTGWSLSSPPNGGPSRIVIDNDGKIYLGGGFTLPWNSIARYLANGQLDSSITLIDGASHGFNGQPASIVPRSDGKVYIGGDISLYKGLTVNRFFRLNNDGSIDSTLPTATGLDGQPVAVTELSDGKIILAGQFSTYKGSAAPRLIRLNSDGSLDTGFNSGGSGANSWINAMAVQPDGKIIITGLFSSYNGTARGKIARINVDGSLDTDFNPGSGANNSPNWIHVLENGQILIAGGDFSTYNGTSTGRIARINTDGSLDITFNSGGAGANSIIYCGAVQSDGKILIGGLFSAYNGTARNRLARLNSDGTLDTSFDLGAGPNEAISVITVQSDGKILIGGGFTSYDGTARSYVARLHP